MIRWRRSDASRAASARVRRAGRSAAAGIGQTVPHPTRAERPGVVKGEKIEPERPPARREPKLPATVSLSGSGAPSNLRSSKRIDVGSGARGLPRGVPAADRRSRLAALPAAPRPSDQGPFGAAHPIGLAAPPASVPTPRFDSHRLLGARRNVPAARRRVNPTFPQVSPYIRRSRGMKAGRTKCDKNDVALRRSRPQQLAVHAQHLGGGGVPGEAQRQACGVASHPRRRRRIVQEP